MVVLFLASAKSTHTVRWVNTLVEKGIEVHLLYNSGHNPFKDKIDCRVNMCELKYSGSKGYYFNAIEVRKYVRRVKPDIINAHYASGYGTLARMADIHPVMLSFWGSDIYEFPFKNHFNYNVIVKNIKKADYIASTSECMARKIKEVIGNDQLNIYLTPFGVDLNMFNPRNYEIIDRPQCIIGTVKSLESVYGIDKLILSFEKLIEKAKNSKFESKLFLDIYGEGSQKNYLQNLINEKNLSDIITLKGKIPYGFVPEALNSFDVFCALSNNESFGVAVIEAMAMEKPVVVSQAEGFKEIVINNKNGFIVDNNDYERISDLIFDIIADNGLMKKMGKEGRKIVEKKYNWNDNVDNMISIYTDIIKEYKTDRSS